MFSHPPFFMRVAAVALVTLAAVQVSGCSSPEEKAEAHYQKGMQLLKDKDKVRAGIEFKNALQKKKDHVGAWRGLATIEEQNGNLPAIAGILRRVTELDPKDADARIRLARLLVVSNDLEGALKQLDDARKLDAKSSAIPAIRGAVELKLNNFSAAVAAANEALKLKPNDSEAVIVLAAERMAQNDPNAALKILSQSPDDTGDLGALIFKLRIYERIGNDAKVEEMLRGLAARFPAELQMRRQLVNYYINKKRIDDAESEVRAIARDNPGSVDAALDIARFLNTYRGPAVAQQELLAHAASGGNKTAYQMLLAELYLAQNEATKAKQVLQSLIDSGGAASDVAAAKVRLADLALGEKAFDAAGALAKSILDADARNVDALRIRAALSMERGDFDPAIADLRQALSDQPQSRQHQGLLALAYERKGEIELAEKQFADATKASNFDPVMGLNYVAFLRRRGSDTRAEDVLVEMLGHNPKNTAVLSTLAEVRLAQQNWIGAQEVADSLRKLSGSQATADQIAAASLAGQNRLDESLGILQTAYAATPGDARPMYALVNAYLRADKANDAIAFLQTALAKEPGNADALVLLGSVQLSQKKSDEAVASFKNAIEKQPKNPAAYRALGTAYMRQGQTDAAIETLKAGLSNVPDSGVLRLALAGALEHKGDFESAIGEYETLHGQQSGSMVVVNNLASLLADHRTDEASLQRAYALAASLRNSPVPQFADTLGWVHYRRGEHRAAVQLLEKAAAALPSLPLIRYHLGMAYVASGEPAKASEQLKKGLDLVGDASDLKKKIEGAIQQLGKT